MGIIHKRTTVWLIVGWIGALPIKANAENLCPNPKPESPGLFFSMTAGAPGDLGRNCENQLNRARYLGFTGLTLTPTFEVNEQGNVKATQSQKDTDECLDLALKYGFEISYKPHIEASHKNQSTLNELNNILGPTITLADSLINSGIAHGSARWRATLAMNPSNQYERKVIGPFLRWLEKNKDQYIKKNAPKAQITVATELHHSVASYPKQWNTLMWSTQKKLEKLGIRNQVQVGIDPSVFSKATYGYDHIKKTIKKEPSSDDIKSPLLKSKDSKTESKKCQQYKELLWTSDFYAPSVYGELAKQGFDSDPVKATKKLMKKSGDEFLENLNTLGCPLDKKLKNRYKNADYQGRDKGRSSKRTQYGELGFGGNLNATYSQFEIAPPIRENAKSDQEYRYRIAEYKRTILVADQKRFRKNAVKWVQASLEGMRNSHTETANIWTTGRFDLFGFSRFPALGDLSSTSGQYNNQDPVRGPDQIPEVAKIRDAIQAYTKDRCTGWKAVVPEPLEPKKEPKKKLRANHCELKAIPPPSYEDLIQFQKDLQIPVPEIEIGEIDFD